MALFGRKKAKDKEVKDKKTAVKGAAVQDGRPEKKVVKPEPRKMSMKDLYSETKTVSVKKPAAAKTESTTTAAATTAQAEKRPVGRGYRILLKPLITEKAANLGAENKYVFAVATGANKIEIAQAVTEVYGIKPVSVNIVKVKGKKVRYGRIQGERRNWKKAIVMLPAGKSINIYEGV
jgi:large subunit ribosomal protein L23